MSILRREHILYIIRTRALALLALMALVGCTSDDATLSEPIPEPTPADGKVAVELALCVSPSQLATTRQPAHENPSSDAFDVTQLSGKYRGIQDLTLIPLSSEGAVLEGSFPGLSRQGETYHYFTDQLTELYIGTSRFLCYAKATPLTATEESDDVKRKFKNGSIISDLGDKAPLNISFELEPIVASPSADGYSVAETMATYLTQIANAGNGAWRTSDDDALHNLFTGFTNGGEPIAGSTANVKEWVNELYGQVNGNTSLTHREDIITAIGNIDDHFTGAAYPANLYLPDGAAAMKWNSTTNKFEVMKSADENTPLSNHSNFTYPAEIYYYCDSKIKSSTSSKASAYTTYTNWFDKTGTDGVLNQYDDDDAVVASTTRSVAIKEPLNYGVCCLKASIQAEATTDDAYLYDNSETPVQIPLYTVVGETKTPNFPLKGILVGGQFPQYFDFTPSTEKNAKECIIYDTELSSSINLTENESASNYTLVFQTREEKPVDIVLEFENKSGVPFTGYEGGIVYPNTKFYLLGQAWPSTSDNETDDLQKRVFTQDHKTTLKLTIQSLKNAYNVIPELKTAQYSIKVVNVGIQKWLGIGSDDRGLYNW